MAEGAAEAAKPRLSAVRTLSFRPFGVGLRALLLIGPAAVLLMGAFTVDFVAGWTAFGTATIIVLVVTFLSGVRIPANTAAVAISLAPFWGKRLRWSNVVSIDVEEVRPFEDFGGWGVKGSHTRRGMLLSTGETRSVVLTLAYGCRHLAAVGDDANAVAATLRGLMPPPTREGALAR